MSIIFQRSAHPGFPEQGTRENSINKVSLKLQRKPMAKTYPQLKCPEKTLLITYVVAKNCKEEKEKEKERWYKHIIYVIVSNSVS